MSKPNIILIGAGGHAQSCIDVIEQHGHYQIAGLVGLPEEEHAKHLGYTVIASDNDLPELIKDYQYAVISVGQIQSPDIRMRLYQRANQLGFVLPTILAPTAYVSTHANVGPGTMVMHGAIINAGARVGNNCIINSRVLIEHNASVDDFCHISTGVIINGEVSIGAGSFIGSACVIKESVAIGKCCVIGMGLAVRHDQRDYTVFTGN